MKNKYNVLIIGAGRIGAFFDSPKSDKILTHAHAFKEHSGFHLVGFIDKDHTKARKAARIWKCQSFSSIKEAFSQKKIDIAVVAVPDNYHFAVLKELSNYKVDLVVAEKPLTKTINEAKQISNIYLHKKIPMLVNYTRRFVPEIRTIQQKIKNKYYGEFISGHAYYGKGLYHNGSHTIDLLRWFISEVKYSKIIESQNDFDPKDPSPSIVLTFTNNKKVYLQAISCQLYTIFETDLLFSKGRVIIERGSKLIEEYKIVKSKVYKGYKNLIKSNSSITGRLQALFYMTDNVYNFLLTGEKLRCSLEDGYQTLLTCSKIGGKLWIN